MYLYLMYLIILLVEARKLAWVAYIYLPNVCMYVGMYVCKLTCNPYPYPRPYTLVLVFFSIGLVWFWHVIKRKRDLDLGYM